MGLVVNNDHIAWLLAFSLAMGFFNLIASITMMRDNAMLMKETITNRALITSPINNTKVDISRVQGQVEIVQRRMDTLETKTNATLDRIIHGSSQK